MRSKIAPLFRWNRPGPAPRRTILKRSSPWSGRYALPRNVLDESTSDGAIVTRQVRRGTVSFVRPGNAGYAVPKYIMTEPPWRGVRVTHQRPRGTIDQYAPNQFIGLGSLDLTPVDGFFGDMWGGIKSAGKGAYRAGKSVVKVGAGLACKVSSSEAAQKHPYVAMVDGLCPKGSVPAEAPPQPGISTTTLIAGGVGLLALVLLLK